MPPTEGAVSFDVIVLGAGISGIIAAQCLLQAHPETHLAILERDYCVGVVWGERKNYPSFWSQWTLSLAEFSDMPMKRPPAEDCMSDLFPARYTTQYLEAYVDKMSHAGKTLRDRIQFNTQVESIRKVNGRWQLQCVDTVSKSQRTMFSMRLMVANGQSSAPNLPNFPGKEHFQGKIIHSIDFGQSDVMQDKLVQHVSVIGAGKSAADMVYEAVKAGKTVSWIIRKTGDGSLGAAALAPIDLPMPYKNGGEASQARIMASLQPCYLIPYRSWWTWLLHSTTLGAKLVTKIFTLLDNSIRKAAGYRERKSCHFADFWPLVAEKVYVHRVSVKLLDGNELYLDDESGTHFPCDAVLCGTGWEIGLDMFDNRTLMELGLPYPKEIELREETAKWEKLEGDVDKQILKRFGMLRNPPKHYHKYETRTPYRLYHTMAPVHDDSILFLNHVVIGAKLFAAEAQAIWAVVYWDKAFPFPSVAEREDDIAHMIAWNKRRYLSNGELGNFVVFDSIPYVDGLFDEMSVTSHRSKGWLGNMFAPIMPADLGKVWDEYLARRNKR
ncbi:flavin-binding monooxygenase-like protein-like protein [Hypoxylon sp. FL1284]|nr:flavin-binding monooxygenase-like protein-like protein [Hypoxylon sp. FL1284]